MRRLVCFEKGLLLAHVGFSTCSVALLQMNVSSVTQCPVSLVVPPAIYVRLANGNVTHTFYKILKIMLLWHA